MTQLTDQKLLLPNVEPVLKLLAKNAAVSHAVWIREQGSQRYSLHVATSLHRWGDVAALSKIRVALRAARVQLNAPIRVSGYNDPALAQVCALFSGQITLGEGSAITFGELKVVDAVVVWPRRS